MRPSLSIKTLYRSPIKTLLTFILLAVVTFAFFSQTAEYAVTAREFNNAAKQYCGVGSAEVAKSEESDPSFPYNLTLSDTSTHLYQPLTQAQINAVSALPYITSADTRYMTAGTSDAYYRLDDGKYFYNFTSRCIIEGTLLGVNPMDQYGYTDLAINDCTLLAGNPPWEVSQSPLLIRAWNIRPAPGDARGFGVDTRSVLILTNDNKYDPAYIQDHMTIGNRYAFIFRFELLTQLEWVSIGYLGDHLSNSWCDAVWPIDGASENYLETDKFAPLRKLVEITNADLHPFDMVYLDDMSAIMRFAKGDMAIVDGRALTKEDSAKKSNVCVVSYEFAKANNLKVGDTITMKLGTELFEQYKALGAIAGTPERYAPPEKSADLEIVGIYADTDGPNKQSREPHWSYSINTIFVPKSLLPIPADELADHQFTPSEFSFKIENAWDIPKFLEEATPMVEEMGLSLVFYDDGWIDIAKGFGAARQLSLIKIAVLSAAVAAATGFVVYLFIGRKKKEYAVMRALGTTRKASARALILPLMAVTIVSVLAGSAAAWIYTVKTISHNNALTLLKEYAVSTTIPVGAAIGCILGELILTLLIALVLLRRIGALAPLSLLQANEANGACRKSKTGFNKPVSADSAIVTTAALSASHTSGLPLTDAAIHRAADAGAAEPDRTVQKSNVFGFVWRYIWKHIRRSTGKSALAILLATLLFVGVGQLGLMKESYIRLCTDTDITANFVGGLTLDAVPEIVNSGYIKNPYYELRWPADINFSRAELVVTNNIARYTGEEVNIAYTDGYDASCMDQFGNVIILGKVLMDSYGLELGGTVQITPARYLEKMQPIYILMYRQMHPNDAFSDEEILPLIQDDLTKALNRVVRTYTIAGVLSTPSGKYDKMAFMPGIEDLSLNLQTAAKLDVAEFTLADNFRSDEFRGFGNRTASESIIRGVAFIMDTSKLENLRNSLRLLNTLYPIALTAALLIGGFLCCLVIVQSSKEAAIMRVLGTTKRRTRTIFTLEQLFLSIAGLIIGACGLLLCKGLALAVIIEQLLVFAALYFAVILVSAVICSTAATRRNVLGLLQTKE